jgi:methionyl-tRNA formyltransferase
MRIVLIGQAAFAEKVLERLIGANENIAALYCPPDVPGRSNSLKDMAKDAGIPVFQPERMKDRGVMDEYKALKPDLNIMAFVTDILPQEMLHFPTHGSIQYHPSLLPKHRGKSAINWAVIKGETRTGLSIFWVDQGIDTGPVLLQKEVEISPEDTTGSLYFNKLFPMGVDALMEALHLIKAGKAPRMVQDDSQATYEPPCDETHARIDWGKPLKEVHNLIRGCDPQPGAYTHFQAKKVQLYGAKAFFDPEAYSKYQHGEVVDITEAGILIAGNGGACRIRKVRLEKEGKIQATEFAQNVNLEKGSRFL